MKRIFLIALCFLIYSVPLWAQLDVSNGGIKAYVGPITKVTDPAWGVKTSNTATQNQTAFASIASAVNAGTTSPYIYVPAGTYNVLSTGGYALGVYNVAITFHCENPQTTIINHTGTGGLIQLGPNGLGGMGSTYIYTPFVFENCQLQGGGSASDGIFNQSNSVGVHIRDNYFYDYGTSSFNAIHAVTAVGYGLGGLFIERNTYFRDDQVAGNFAYAHSGTGATYTYIQAMQNIIVCANSTTDLNTHVCGTGISSDGYLEAKFNFSSGPSPTYVCGAKEYPSSTCVIDDNLIEIFGSGLQAILYGTVGGGSETVSNVMVRNNNVYVHTGGLVGPANSSTKIINSSFSGNRLRSDSLDHGALMLINDISGQDTGNTAFDNQGWTHFMSPFPLVNVKTFPAYHETPPEWQNTGDGVTTVGNGGGPHIAFNGYYESGWKYYKNGASTIISNDCDGSGAICFETAPSGTAGNAITYTNQMLLKNAGEVDVMTPLHLSVPAQIQTPSEYLTLGNNGPSVGANVIYNSGWKYLANGFATLYDGDCTGNGDPCFLTAVSGSANGAITWKQPLTILNTGAVYQSADAIGTVGASLSLDVTKPNVHTLTSTASTNMTITPTAGGAAGQCLQLLITSDGTGGDVLTFASPFKSAGAMTLTASRKHSISFCSDGTNLIETARATNLN